jgi:hypothetical protein
MVPNNVGSPLPTIDDDDRDFFTSDGGYSDGGYTWDTDSESSSSSDTHSHTLSRSGLLGEDQPESALGASPTHDVDFWSLTHSSPESYSSSSRDFTGSSSPSLSTSSSNAFMEDESWHTSGDSDADAHTRLSSNAFDPQETFGDSGTIATVAAQPYGRDTEHTNGAEWRWQHLSCASEPSALSRPEGRDDAAAAAAAAAATTPTPTFSPSNSGGSRHTREINGAQVGSQKRRHPRLWRKQHSGELHHNSVPATDNELDAALDALMPASGLLYYRRPVTLCSVRPQRHLYVEKGHWRRGSGDKWISSGGQAGGADYMTDGQVGLRKRYGRVQLKATGTHTGGKQQGVTKSIPYKQYTILRTEKDGSTVEDKFAKAWIIEADKKHTEREKPKEGLAFALLGGVATVDLFPEHAVRAIRSLPTKLNEYHAVGADVVTDGGAAARSVNDARGRRVLDLGNNRSMLAPLESIQKRAHDSSWDEVLLTSEPDHKRRKSAMAKLLLAGMAVAVTVSFAYVAVVAHVLSAPSQDRQQPCAEGTFLAVQSQLPIIGRRCKPCRDCALLGVPTIRACTPLSDTACEWMWEHGKLQSSSSGDNIDMDPHRHLPQLAATWVAGTSVYSFGGSGSSMISNPSNASVDRIPSSLTAGERCTTEATGVSSELWKFTKASGWSQQSQALAPNGPSVTQGGDQHQQLLWPRRRYAAATWALNSSKALIFSGTFELCLATDYGWGDPLNVDGDYIIGPASLFLMEETHVSAATRPNHTHARWSLLGGADEWRRVRPQKIAQLMVDGQLAEPHACHRDDSNQVCSWPLPRAHAHTWMLNGIPYMFGGIFNLIEGGFDDLSLLNLLMNDFWQLQLLGLSGEQTTAEADQIVSVDAVRLAGCSRLIEEPRVLPPAGGTSSGAVASAYPGPRYKAATWVAGDAAPVDMSSGGGDRDTGWLFGGIGRRVSASVSDDSSSCQVMEDMVHGRVTNLCDLWSFLPGVGFTLVAACEADVAELRTAGLIPRTVVPMSAGPTAGISVTAFVLGPQSSQSLWMFGGITACSPVNEFNDSVAVPLIDEFVSENARRAHLNSCDMNVPGLSDGPQDYASLAAFADGHPNQPCTADLWRFSLRTASWESLRPTSTSVNKTDAENSFVWPDARCGAAAITGLGNVLAQETSTSRSLDSEMSTVAIVGGWGGPASGECEEWPTCNATHSSDTTSVRTCLYKSYLSDALPLEERAARAHVANCAPISDVWQFSVASGR